MKKIQSGLAALLLCLAGCVSYEYQGESAAPTTGLAVFTDSAKITAPYRVLGTATVSGDYQNISRDRMIAKLRSEGTKCGANAILIVEQQVVPYGQTGQKPRQFSTSFDYDETNRSWSQIYQDVNQTYGNVRQAEAPTEEVASFRRIIRAEFLRYNQPNDAPAPAVKAPAPAKATSQPAKSAK